MFKLGEAVFHEGVTKLLQYKGDESQFIFKRSKLIIQKRLAVVEFVTGLELILKAILLRNGYSIYKFRRGMFKMNEKVGKIVSEDRTLDLAQVIDFFRSNYETLPFKKVDKLRELRNQIVHRGTNIDEKKRDYFIAAIDCLSGLYKTEKIKHKKFLETIAEARERI